MHYIRNLGRLMVILLCTSTASVDVQFYWILRVSIGPSFDPRCDNLHVYKVCWSSSSLVVAAAAIVCSNSLWFLRFHFFCSLGDRWNLQFGMHSRWKREFRPSYRFSSFSLALLSTLLSPSINVAPTQLTLSSWLSSKALRRGRVLLFCRFPWWWPHASESAIY